MWAMSTKKSWTENAVDFGTYGINKCLNLLIKNNMYPSDFRIDQIISDLRKLKKDICKYEALSQKAFDSDTTDFAKKNTALLWQKMEVENQLRHTTHKIQESKIIVSLEPEDFYVSNMHKYKLWTPN